MINRPRIDSSKTQTTGLVHPQNNGTTKSRRDQHGHLTRRTAMDIVFIGLGIMLGIWILVIWGSSLFNKNMQ
jgi:hypothetical protein